MGGGSRRLIGYSARNADNGWCPQLRRAAAMAREMRLQGASGCATIPAGSTRREGTMAMDQAAATRVVNEYLDELDRRQKEGPLRLREAFEKSPPGVGVHE